MNKTHSGSAVPRHLVFALVNGAFVVQWTETRVQDLYTGDYLAFGANDYGRPLSDAELEQLKGAGQVEQFNASYVWLYALPEENRFPELRVQEKSRDRARSYYLNTTLAETEVEHVRALLETLDMVSEYTVTVQGELVAIFGKEAKAFSELKAAENAQRQLAARAPEVFADAVIGFIETPAGQTMPKTPRMQTMEMVDLATILASQSDTSLTIGKRVLLACAGEAACHVARQVLGDLRMDIRQTTSAQETLALAEDVQPHLLVTDLQMPDMHAWEMLARLREITSLRDMLTVVLADDTASLDHEVFGMTVANVDAYLVKPFSPARLRLCVWLAFKEQAQQ